MQIKKAHPILDENNQFYFAEFFSGLKDKTSSRMFPLVYMGQRFLSCSLVIFLAQINLVVKMVILTVIQAANLIYLLVVRPFELTKNLILETMSQIIMVFFSGMLIYFNSKYQWNNTINWVFIGTLMGSSLVSTLIAFIDIIIVVKNKIKQRFCLKPRVENYSANQPSFLILNRQNTQNPTSIINTKSDNSIRVMEEEKVFSFDRMPRITKERQAYSVHPIEKNLKFEHNNFDSVLNIPD